MSGRPRRGTGDEHGAELNGVGDVRVVSFSARKYTVRGFGGPFVGRTFHGAGRETVLVALRRPSSFLH
eukprot:6449329-Prymnesium_polylepis.1